MTKKQQGNFKCGIGYLTGQTYLNLFLATIYSMILCGTIKFLFEDRWWALLLMGVVCLVLDGGMVYQFMWQTGGQGSELHPVRADRERTVQRTEGRASRYDSLRDHGRSAGAVPCQNPALRLFADLPHPQCAALWVYEAHSPRLGLGDGVDARGFPGGRLSFWR